MVKRTLLSLFFLAPLASPALAQDPSCSHEQKISCAEGSTWDDSTKTCVKQVIG